MRVGNWCDQSCDDRTRDEMAKCTFTYQWRHRLRHYQPSAAAVVDKPEMIEAVAQWV